VIRRTARFFFEQAVAKLPAGLGIPRSQMPQIRSTDVPDFLRWLVKDQRIPVKRQMTPVGRLTPTQKELDLEKVSKLMGQPEQLRKPLIASREGRILDGHHRWAALYRLDPNVRVPVYHVSLPIKGLLNVGHRFGKSFTKKVGEAAAQRKFVVFRVGSAGGGLDNRNAANLAGLISYLDHAQERGLATGGHVTMYEVTMSGDFGPFQPLAGGRGARGTGNVAPQVGRRIEGKGGWKAVQYSFPAGGSWQARRVKTIPLQRVLDVPYVDPKFGKMRLLDGGFRYAFKVLTKLFGVRPALAMGTG
jgi:hypothetical protein